MKIEVFEISDEQVNQILQLHEGHFYDLKRIEIKPAKLTNSLSAFANSDGGDIYIGISEEKKDQIKSREWKGFSDHESANAHIQVIHEHFPFEQYITAAFLKNNKKNGFVLHIQIHKTKEITKASEGFPYVRRGAQNLPVKTHEDLKKLEFDKGISSYEKQTLSIPLSFITDSETVKKFVTKVVPSSKPEPWLKKQLLIENNKPTVASVILYSDEPQAALPKQCGIKLFRYKTKEKEGSRQSLAFDPLTIEGCAYDQINLAVIKTIETVQGIQFLGDEGFEKVDYPQEALHEIITNAVLHRDYSLASDIKIAIFDNRIEITSPGKLPGHITTKNILDEQLARNGAIVRFINKFPNPPNKDVGEGLNTAFSAMKKLRLKEPHITEQDNSVVVKIFHEQLASPEEIVMNYLETNKEISNSVARDLCAIDSENLMKRVFQKLQTAGLLERTPNKRGSASRWRKPENASNSESTQLTLFS
jgi:ATP-dependent DNA helicase RecG